MSNTESADRLANRLVHLKEWQDRSAKITWVITGILIAGILIVLFGFPLIAMVLLYEDIPWTVKSWSNAISNFPLAWNFSTKPMLFGIALFFVGVTSYSLARIVYRAEKRKVIKAPERVEIMDALIHRVQNRDLGYQGVETILWDFGIYQRTIDAWPAWQPLLEHEYKEVWVKFRQVFQFNRDSTPAIKEPIPSITYHIKGEDYSYSGNFKECLLHYFQDLIPEGDRMYALDWRYPDEDGWGDHDDGYRFYPHSSGKWPVDLVPDQLGFNRNYYVFLQNNFEFGVFCNSREQTMCVFGEKLLIEVNKTKPMVFYTVLRTNGTKV